MTKSRGWLLAVGVVLLGAFVGVGWGTRTQGLTDIELAQRLLAMRGVFDPVLRASTAKDPGLLWVETERGVGLFVEDAESPRCWRGRLPLLCWWRSRWTERSADPA